MKFYWAVEYDGEWIIDELSNKSIARIDADEWWSEYCCECGISHNETMSGEVHLVCYYIKDSGEVVIDEREKYVLEEMGYHGDLKEHGCF